MALLQRLQRLLHTTYRQDLRTDIEPFDQFFQVVILNAIGQNRDSLSIELQRRVDITTGTAEQLRPAV